MTSPGGSGVGRFRSAVERLHRDGTFGESDYLALREVLAGTLGRRRPQHDLLDGLANLFFERHLMAPARRAELLALDDAGLERAVRHRFRQLMADSNEDHRPFHALAAHVREVLAQLERRSAPPGHASWPATIRDRQHFVRAGVEQAVAALWCERGARPTAVEATAELLARYQVARDLAEDSSTGRSLPGAVLRRLDGQRLALGILRLLTADEKDLLRHVLADEGSIEDWAQKAGCSRATAYRMMARLKALCRLEFRQRSDKTQLEALHALKANLSPP